MLSGREGSAAVSLPRTSRLDSRKRSKGKGRKADALVRVELARAAGPDARRAVGLADALDAGDDLSPARRLDVLVADLEQVREEAVGREQGPDREGERGDLVGVEREEDEEEEPGAGRGAGGREERGAVRQREAPYTPESRSGTRRTQQGRTTTRSAGRAPRRAPRARRRPSARRAQSSRRSGAGTTRRR